MSEYETNCWLLAHRHKNYYFCRANLFIHKCYISGFNSTWVPPIMGSLNMLRASLYPPDVTKGVLQLNPEGVLRQGRVYMAQVRTNWKCILGVWRCLRTPSSHVQRAQVSPLHRSNYLQISTSVGIPGTEAPQMPKFVCDTKEHNMEVERAGMTR